MAEELNVYFSWVFTREDTTPLPILDAQIGGPKSERLGKLIVIREIIPSNIKYSQRTKINHTEQMGFHQNY